MSRAALSSRARAGAHTHLRLYVAGSAPNASRAARQLRVLCDRYLAGCRLELVDVLREPGRALADGVLVTPTLLRLRPEPVVTVVGDLGASQLVLEALGLAGRRA